MNSLRDQVALVTGSTRVIGAPIAKLYAQHGAKVVIPRPAGRHERSKDGARLSTETSRRLS